MEIVARLLVSWGINVLALIVADWAFDGMMIGHWGPIALAGAVLGFANTFLKPLLTFIAIPLIILTLGVAYFFVSVAMLLSRNGSCRTSRSTASGRTSGRRSSSGS